MSLPTTFSSYEVILLLSISTPPVHAVPGRCMSRTWYANGALVAYTPSRNRLFSPRNTSSDHFFFLLPFRFPAEYVWRNTRPGTPFGSSPVCTRLVWCGTGNPCLQYTGMVARHFREAASPQETIKSHPRIGNPSAHTSYTIPATMGRKRTRCGSIPPRKVWKPQPHVWWKSIF